MWKVTLYKNTGLNSVNTLDNPKRLSKVEHIDLPALDILQGEFLSNVNVKATRNDVKDTDFCVLKDEETGDTFFYSVESFTSTSYDVQSLQVVMDSILTLVHKIGGLDKVVILDGITERHHVAKADDKFGAFTEDDPLLIPSKELNYEFVYAFDDRGEQQTGQTTFIQSTVDLVATARNSGAITYMDSSANAVTVPAPAVPITTGRDTIAKFGATWASFYRMIGSRIYVYEQDLVKAGVKRLRDLGIEGGSLVSCYSMPNSCFNIEMASSQGLYIDILAGTMHETSGLKMSRGSGREANMRLFYGNINSVELMSIGAGTRVTFKPEDIAKYNEDGTVNTQVKLIRITDPRPNGRPYFQPKYYRGIDNSSNVIFFANALPGMTWASVPIIYTEKSGSELNQLRYDTTREGMNIAYNQATNSLDYSLGEANTRRRTSFFGNVGNYASRGIVGGAIAAGSAALNNALEQTFDELRTDFSKNQIAEMYAYNARKELLELNLNNKIVAPELNFPQSDTLRDFAGNGVIMLQYRPSDSDMLKLDRILTMYGYRDTKPLQNIDFTNRSRFNYVKASGVSFGGDIPKWLRESAAAQLSSGVRIWHVMPDIKYYTFNNV